MLKVYKKYLSPVLHAIVPGIGCRFHPTCSVYAKDAVKMHGVVKGSCLAACRVARCNPLCKGGYDPVPQAKK